MKAWVLRKLYGFLYWMGQLSPTSNINYGYFRKFKKPEDVADADLHGEIQKLGKAIETASN